MSLGDGHPATIKEAALALRSGAATSAELTESLLERANALDASLGVYLSRFDESALEAARRADAELRAGRDRGPLHGIPMGVKDLIRTREAPTTANSRVRVPAWDLAEDACIVARLRAAGAVITGKVNTMEFACGAPDPMNPGRPPANPWDLAHWAGGSSSGSASGVAAGLFPAALGTDTGASIRLPAAFCGVTGLKPTFGRVPVHGVIPVALSTDVVGPLARTALDAGLVLQAIAGHDPRDPSSVRSAVPDFCDDEEEPTLAGLRIGVERCNHSGRPGEDPDVMRRFDTAIEVLEDCGRVAARGRGSALRAAARCKHAHDLRRELRDPRGASRRAVGTVRRPDAHGAPPRLAHEQ